jgi:hypothetical protein
MIDINKIRGQQPDLRALFPMLSDADVAFIDAVLLGRRNGFVSAVRYQVETAWRPQPPTKANGSASTACGSDISPDLTAWSLEYLGDHRKRMEKVAALADQLSSMIRDLDLSLVNRDISELDTPSKLRLQLSTLAEKASLLATDEDELKLARFEDPAHKRQRKPTPSYFVSRRVIAEYRNAGHKLSIGAECQLHRLLLLAHHAAKIDVPSFTRLRNYVNDFKRMPR